MCGPQAISAGVYRARQDPTGARLDDMATVHPASAHRLLINHFVLDRSRRELVSPSGSPADLRHKALEVLLVLGEHAGHVVSKNDLLARVWPGVVVTDDSLTQTIAEIRRCLGDTQHRWVRTAIRRGYSLHAEAEPSGGATVTAAATGRAADHPPLATHEALLGREADCCALQSLVREVRMVTLVGPGGIGKTRLALAVAQGLAGPFDHRVWWVDLALAPGPLPLAPQVAVAARVDLPPGEPLASLASALRDEQALLILDNCEHRIDEVAALAMALLAGASGVRMLATSQEALKVPGEQVYRIATLACPDIGATLDEARRCAGFALMERRAREADHSFCIDGQSLAPAIELCRRLDGMPLALEMAAARLPSVGVGGVLRLLGEQLTLLKRARRGGPARHETLHATLAWSCALLDDGQRAALYGLAAFAGPFEATMAQVVVAPDASEAECIDTLCTLVDKSLLSVEPGNPPRYRLYESMRVYAAAHLNPGADLAEIGRRHGRAMAEHADALRRTAPGGTHDAVLIRFGSCYADFDAAFARACSVGDGETAARTLTALRLLDQLRGEMSATERRLVDVQPLLATCSARARAHILLMRASAGWVDMAAWPTASAAAEAVQAWRALGDDVPQLHHALLLQAGELARAGDCRAARQALDDAATLRGAGSLPVLHLFACMFEGHAAIFCGEWQLGLDSLRAALALARRSGKTRLACHLLCDLAEAALMAGDLAAALDYSETAVREARACRAQQFLAQALLAQLEARLVSGNAKAAVAVAGETLALGTRYGMHTSVAAVFAALGLHVVAPEAACRLLGYALARQRAHNARDRHRARGLQTLRQQAEGSLGASAVADLLRVGAQLGADEVIALADQMN